MLLHLVLVAVRATGMATPKAVLAELVAVALLTPVSEAHHALAVTVGTFHRMEDWEPARRGDREQDSQLKAEAIRRKAKPTVTAMMETDRTKSLNCLTSDTAVPKSTRMLARVCIQKPSHHLVQLPHPYRQHLQSFTLILNVTI